MEPSKAIRRKDSPMLIVTAKVRLRPGTSEEFLEAFRVMHPQVLNDPGVIAYTLHRSAEDPDMFIFYEQYESQEAFDYHLSTDHFKVLAGCIDPLMAVPGEIGTWVEVA
jgi:quinol monooxygenase YgiN